MTLTPDEIKQLQAMFRRVNKGQVKVEMYIGYESDGEGLFTLSFSDKIDNRYLGSFESPVEIEEDEK